ncbi:Rrf2 family transcriptional regulator [Paenibacillus thalictri]|uniref:Rrf2 family transcriptional regulator n=1 Tax=Paenibacillus thalictri TaxID=2527873 RepID=A0A4Q9DVI9_9BACL|nr:Rrf2 family transcriptional regulator [Paenibacillus thalictri]TBL81029.1 Rrf2 family transcriptional regulator [Paenibacillus thalictri]
MYANSQFIIAVQMLTILARYNGQKIRSEWMAQSVNANPVIIRRILAKLVKGGLVTASTGANGGSLLARPPEQISLLDVYRVEGKRPFCLPENKPDRECMVGRNIQTVLCGKLTDAESAMEHKLAEVTIADLYRECAQSDGSNGLQ